jgi:YD repeat-containing protein
VLHASADYDLEWNKPADIYDFNRNKTSISYYGTYTGSCPGNGYSLPCVVTRPDIPEDQGSPPTYQYSYTAAGKLDTVIDPDQIATKNIYDGSDNLQQTTQGNGTGLGLTTVFGYDAEGNVIKTTDPRLIDTTSCYDLARRRIETDHHNGQATTLLAGERIYYDEIGRDTEDDRATSVSGAHACTGSDYGTGGTWQIDRTIDYTLTSKVHIVTDADNKQTITDYDDDDRVWTITDPAGRKTHFQYCVPAFANCAPGTARMISAPLERCSSATGV